MSRRKRTGNPAPLHIGDMRVEDGVPLQPIIRGGVELDAWIESRRDGWWVCCGWLPNGTDKGPYMSAQQARRAVLSLRVIDPALEVLAARGETA